MMRLYVVRRSRSPLAVAIVAITVSLTAFLWRYLGWALVLGEPATTSTELITRCGGRPVVCEEVERVVRTMGTPAQLLAGPVWDDLVFGLIVAVVVYFLLVGLILSARALRATPHDSR